MTLEQAIEIKSQGRWGAQGGLLSASEMVCLNDAVKTYMNGDPADCLEIGHYNGLSTMLLWGQCSRLLSIDAHIVDAWVKDSNEAAFVNNLSTFIDTGWVQSLIMDSRAIKSLHGFNFVFYDGDHADEQSRFTQLVHDSPNVKLFIFDDRDFPVPQKCYQWLIEQGWTDQSPPLARLEGDKTNPHTMTLGIFTR